MSPDLSRLFLVAHPRHLGPGAVPGGLSGPGAGCAPRRAARMAREGGMNRVIQGAFWIGVYLLLTLAQLFILLIGSTPPGRSFCTEFSIAIGFAGLAIMGMQFLLTS